MQYGLAALNAGTISADQFVALNQGVGGTDIDANFTAFVGYAHGLHDAGMAMLAAIDKKDVEAMGPAGEKLDAACEACHRAYWYPNAPEPIQTFEGKKVGVN